PRDFLLSSASGSLLGQGVLATATGVEDLSEVLAVVATDTGRAAVAVGALPFDRDAPAHLVVPEPVRRGPAAASAAEAAPARLPLSGTWTATPVPDPAEHTVAAKRAVALMTDPGDTAPRKVVLAPCLRPTGTREADGAAVLAPLPRTDPPGLPF